LDYGVDLAPQDNEHTDPIDDGLLYDWGRPTSRKQRWYPDCFTLLHTCLRARHGKEDNDEKLSFVCKPAKGKT
jgi:hypothetical protein